MSDTVRATPNVAFKRLRRRWVWFAALALLVALVIADRRGWLLVRQTDDLAAYHGRSVAIARVIDGDTIDVTHHDELTGESTTRVRLWGIDCPELGRFGEAAQPMASEARDFLAGIAGEQDVTLYLEPHQMRDAFGRVLAHVQLPDGRFINEALLEAGYAKADDRWPHTRLTRYAQVELSARRAKTGLWSDRQAATSMPQVGEGNQLP